MEPFGGFWDKLGAMRNLLVIRPACAILKWSGLWNAYWIISENWFYTYLSWGWVWTRRGNPNDITLFWERHGKIPS
jgi:hypothetical protein